jgi:hypothetical protein
LGCGKILTDSSAFTMTETLKDTQDYLLDLLYQILKEHPSGIKEYDLLDILANEKINIFSNKNKHDDLILFQTHFLLFHHLYLLQKRLILQEKNNIKIHCLNIALTPYKQQRNQLLPETKDPLRDYYLDLENLRKVDREEVEKMLTKFWEIYSNFDQRPNALAMLGLEATATTLQIKQRFRQLAFIYHPDKGGCSKRFQQITEAAEVLLSTPV